MPCPECHAPMAVTQTELLAPSAYLSCGIREEGEGRQVVMACSHGHSYQATVPARGGRPVWHGGSRIDRRCAICLSESEAAEAGL
jgi:hypothetical protein